MKHLALLTTSLILAACSAATSAPEADPAPQVESVATDAIAFNWPRSYDYMAEGATLVFSATRDWRHDSGISAASAFWARESDDNNRGFFVTEHPGIFTDENLKKFKVIILNNCTGQILSEEQQAAIERFVKAGGGIIAQHATGDSSLAGHWSWWAKKLGTEFVSHPADPQFQTADVVTLATGHPVMKGLGAKFSHNDEWYSFTGPVSGPVVVLAGLDESTYSPVNKVYGVEDLRMGPEPEDHPIVWAKCAEKGKIVYSALGHRAESYDNPEHQTLLKNAYDWVVADGSAGCPE